MEKLIRGARLLDVPLSSDQVGMFERYYELLVDWNRQVNLTTVTDYGSVQVRHFLDSLSVLSGLDEQERTAVGSIVDIGSGAGLPGVPLKIVLPDVRVLLIEATGKKAAFLERLVDELGLTSVKVEHARAEVVAHSPLHREHFGLAVSRAVATLPALLELALPFCCKGAYFVAQKGVDVEEELTRGQQAADALGGQLQRICSISIAPSEPERKLLVWRKIRPTPAKYPRRPGVPQHRPLS